MTFIAQPVLSVLELFKGPLASMRFGDVDAEALTLLAANVERAGIEVTNAEAKLSELRQLLAAEQEALLALAQRALAYARVYAESHDELTTELNGISLPRPAKARKASAAKPSDAEGVPGSLATPNESGVADAELTSASAPLEAREVELDAERNEVEAKHGSNARKSRRNRPALADVHSVGPKGANASE